MRIWLRTGTSFASWGQAGGSLTEDDALAVGALLNAVAVNELAVYKNVPQINHILERRSADVDLPSRQRGSYLLARATVPVVRRC